MNSLQTISIISLIVGGISAVIILVDILSGYRQKMMIMNFVYPITGLYAGIFSLIFYFTIGKKSSQKKAGEGKKSGKEDKQFWQKVSIGVLHCGSGCTLGDLSAEFLMLFFPVIIFGSYLTGKWVVDYIFAFIIGIIFQYFAIKPMKKLSPKEAFKAALKADSLSLTFWQIGMYGWMAIAIFLLFHQKLEANNPLFWFMMQIGMLCGFITSFPINWWLIKKGIKEVM